ncbi:MAG TPA: ribosome-associated translation inhibitor RaiA [Gemmatimonadota bacterium]|nr:ribosome-associated translation inhibitor RaiA [Gemmatimonadota bacterium]
METTLSVRHADVPDALRQYARDQVNGLSRFFSRLVEADIILDQEGHRHIAEVRLRTSSDTHFARSENGDMRAAIDATIDKMGRQLRDHKGRLNNHPMPHEERERLFGGAASLEEPPAPDASRAPDRWPRITVSEATARLEISGDDVIVFVDAVDGVVRIGRRSEGGAVRVEEAESFELEGE